MRRHASLLAVAVALAGCAGLPGSPPEDFAPGVTVEGVANATALESAHRAVLDGTAYTFTRNASQRIDAPGYRYRVEHDARAYVAADGAYLYVHRASVRGTDRRSDRRDGVWSNGTVAVERTVDRDDGTVTYRRYRPPEPYSAANVTRTTVETALRNASVTATWNESGRAYARLHASETETLRVRAPNGTAVNATTRRNATAVVRPDGVVRALDVSVAGRRPLPMGVADAAANRSLAAVSDRSRSRYSALGSTTVPRPAWVDAALAATAGLEDGERTRPRQATDG